MCIARERHEPPTGPQKYRLDLTFPDDVNLLIDLVGDTTVRPCPPHLLAQLEAEREKIVRWQQWRKQQAAQEKPPEDTDPKNGAS